MGSQREERSPLLCVLLSTGTKTNDNDKNEEENKDGTSYVRREQELYGKARSCEAGARCACGRESP